jgi:hypothetical protein
MMKILTTAVLASAFLSYVGVARSQAVGQTNGSATSSTSTQAGKSSAQVSSNAAASASARTGQGSANLGNGASMNAALSQPVDAKKNKPGDPITAKTTEATKSGGKVVLPKGTKLVGHVTQARARVNDASESAVGIVFDKAILKNGQEIPLNATVQALAAAQTAAGGSVGADDLGVGGAIAGGRASGGGTLGGVRSTTGAAAGAVTSTTAGVGGAATGAAGSAVNSKANVASAARGTTGGLNSAGRLSSNSRGVFGLEGINLNSTASNDTQGSLITSTGKNVHLDSGTQMLLVTHGQTSASSSTP